MSRGQAPGHVQNGELWWQLDVKCDEPRGRDEHVRRRIDIVVP